MQITVKAAIGAEVTSMPIEVEPNWMVKSLIIEFCQKIDIPITGNIQMKDDSGLILNKHASIGEAGIHNGDIVFISQTEPEQDDEALDVRPSQPMERQAMPNILLVFVGFVLVTGSICGIIALAMRFTEEICTDEGYGAVFDAGSSHTNLTIYSWPGDTKTGGTGIVKQQRMCRAPGGGISSYDDHPQDAGPSLTSCLDDAKRVVSKDYYNFTSLHLGATAGMRLLNQTEHSTSTLIMESVRQTMASYPFNFHPDQATIISGSDEGSYGWISANFLSGTLNPGSTLSRVVTSTFSSDPLSTIGALDLGGASTQITFVPEDPSSVPPQYTETFRLYGVNHTIYTHSYLCYGVNEAIRRFKAILVKDSGYAKITDNPCAPRGFTEPADAKYLWEAPCSRGPQALVGWGSEVTPPASAENTTFHLNGTGDLDQCQTAVKKLFNFTAPCLIEPCSFNGVYQPKPNGKFLAFSNYENLIRGLGLPNDATIPEIQSTTKSFCAKTYDEIEKMSGITQLLVLYCFEINFVSTLLLEGYHFDLEDTWKILFTGEVKGQELGWSLGFMINATNMIPSEAACTNFTQSGFYIGIAILIIAFLVGFVLLAGGIYRCTRPRQQGGYEELNPIFANEGKYGSI